MQRRVGPAASVTLPGLRADAVGVLVGKRLVGVEPAIARSGQRGVRATATVAEDRGAPAAGLLFLAISGVLLFLGKFRFAPDVDAPAGQARGEPRVLAFAADRQAELVVG